jgi:hypothetical protein
MRIAEIENFTDNLPEAAERAAGDIKGQEDRLRGAEADLAKTSAELDRLRRLAGNLQSTIANLSAKARDAKLAALSSFVAERDSAASFATYRKLKAERQEAAECLSFTTSWAISDAERANLLAQIFERECAADALESKATAHRLAMAVAASSAMEFDPGARISTEGSWSERQLSQVNEIRSRTLPQLREQLKTLETQIVSERELVAVNLFS